MASIGRPKVAWMFFFALVLGPGLSRAADTKLQTRAKAYAKRNRLPTKTVEVKIGRRKVKRVFVPVLERTAEAFARAINAHYGAVVVRQSSTDAIHQSLLFSLGDGVTYNTGTRGGGYIPDRRNLGMEIGQAAHPTWNPATGGRYVALELKPREVSYLLGFLEWGQRSGGQPVAQCPHGGCIWWLVHAQVGNNKPLAWAMGVKQSKNPEVITKKFVHAGNERVSVIGIVVQNANQFKAMSNAQLLGPPPPMGVAEAMHQEGR